MNLKLFLVLCILALSSVSLAAGKFVVKHWIEIASILPLFSFTQLPLTVEQHMFNDPQL
jgi:hypothetical protein